MPPAVLIESAARDGSVIVLELPEDFHQVPLDATVERRTRAQLQLLDDMGLSDSGQREAVSLYLEALSIRLSAADDVLGTAFCAVALRGEPSTATVTVAVHDTHTDDPGLAVLGAAEVMRRDGRLGLVDIVKLGQQPVVTARTWRHIGSGQTRQGESGSSSAGDTLRELSVFVPVPRRRQAAMVVLSTPSLQDWDVYEGLTFDICRSVHVRSSVAGALS